MNKDILKGHWREAKGKVKQQWGKFTDDEITQMSGAYDELAGKLQKKYGYQQDQAKREIDQFIKDNHWDEEDF